MILKDYIPDNHALTTFHRVMKIEVNPPFANMLIDVLSYASEAAFLAGAGHTWSTPISMPTASINGPVLASVEAWLTTSADSPFAGGSIVADQSESLENAKTRTWARVKQSRAQAELADFTCDGAVYQASKEQISGAALGALVAKLAGAPFAQKWTLRDNTEKTLNADQMIAVGVALLQNIAVIYDGCRILREQIDAATTIAELNAIAWPPA